MNFSTERKQEETGNIIELWDWENISRAVRDMGYKRENYDLLAGFKKLEQWLTERGKVIRTYIFAPMHRLYGVDTLFYNQGFRIILCPKIRVIVPEKQVITSDKPDKSRGNSKKFIAEWIDTTDKTIISEGEFLIEQIKDLNWLCFASGDGHFTPFLERAKNKGIKIAIVHGSELSLSSEMRNLVDENPKTGKKMLHLFSPTKT